MNHYYSLRFAGLLWLGLLSLSCLSTPNKVGSETRRQTLAVSTTRLSLNSGLYWVCHRARDFSSQRTDNAIIQTEVRRDTSVPIGIIELRNYVIKHGLRDSFIRYFEENLIAPQRKVNGYVLGQYRVKGAPDNFCWIRGFKDMKERSAFLPTFYYGATWKKHRSAVNAMLANNDNVYLLEPLVLRGDSLQPAPLIHAEQLIPTQGICVVEFYIANTKLNQLLKLFAQDYLPLLHASGVWDVTLWTSVLEENDFPRLPVFQDKNLFVSTALYPSESAYRETMKNIDAKLPDDLRVRLQDVITIKNTMILYPIQKTQRQ